MEFPFKRMEHQTSKPRKRRRVNNKKYVKEIGSAQLCCYSRGDSSIDAGIKVVFK